MMELFRLRDFPLRLGAFALSCCLCGVSASAEGWNFGGHAKYQFTYSGYHNDDINAAFGDESARDHGAEVRLTAERRSGAWDVAAHYELLAVQGDALEARRRLATLGFLSAGTVSGLPDDRRRLFDLTHELTDDTRTAAVHRLDRLSVGYTTEGQVWRAGRQIVSWGNGLVFHPLDFVNPFSPIAIDKDYKTGDDMIFGQWTLVGGGDVQAIVVPRRDMSTREVEAAESTLALKWRRRVGAFDLDLLAARHFDEGLAGVGLTRSIGGAVWRLDVSYTDLANDDGTWSAVTNLDYSWTWFGRNVYGYAEYFRNGVGESDRSGYGAPHAALSARIARGELYTLARDYLALGLRVELDPLVNLFASAIRNLDDGSTYAQARGVYDWRQHVQFSAGVDVPLGDRGEEYGGVAVPGSGAYAAPGRAVYLRAAYYF